MFLIFALRSKSLNNIFFRVSAVVPIVELVALNISRFVSFFTALSAIFGVFVRSRFSGSVKVTLMRISIARWRKSFRALINIHVDEYPRIFGKKIMSRVFVGSQFNDLTTDNFRVKQTHFWVGMNKLWSLSAMRVCLTKFHFHKTPNRTVKSLRWAFTKLLAITHWPSDFEVTFTFFLHNEALNLPLITYIHIHTHKFWRGKTWKTPLLEFFCFLSVWLRTVKITSLMKTHRKSSINFQSWMRNAKATKFQ